MIAHPAAGGTGGGVATALGRAARAGLHSRGWPGWQASQHLPGR